MNTAIFQSFCGANEGWSASFSAPCASRLAHKLEEVLPALRWGEKAANNGYWVAVMLSYEAAPALDHALKVDAGSEFPLACVTIFDKADQSLASAMKSRKPYRASPWHPRITTEEYYRNLLRVREHIGCGNTYQVNYSFPLRCKFAGDSWSWYRNLCAAQRAGFCAYLDLGRYHVLSLSPELFFQRHGNNLITRPMKGTMPRGRWLEEDEAKAKELGASAKNKAENVMIVDLLRNDLGKVAVPGSVKVTDLFTLEKYETLWQMTSTVEARCRADVTFIDIFRALFPCGSITGAPKVRTMGIIEESESLPRDIYTGTIGFITPGGDCIFNVAIRTILLDTTNGEATFGVGGAITADSIPEGEYEECVLKASFLNRQNPEFRLLETMLLEDGRYFLLERHIERMGASAVFFGFSWNKDAIHATLENVRANHAAGTWKVRLLAARDGRIDTEVEELTRTPNRKVRVALASESINHTDPFVFHKTTNRVAYEDAQRARPDCDDIILWNDNNEITESTIANIVVERKGKKWTPPRASGLLAGTFRDELLQRGEIQERVIYKGEFRRADRVWLINSVRKWMRGVVVEC